MSPETPPGADPLTGGEQGARAWFVRGSSLGGIASAGAAALAGLCCLGPVSVAVLGISGAVAAAGLKSYRWPLLLGSALLIAGAFWGATRSRSSAGDSCPVRMGRSLRIGLWAATVVWGVAAVLTLVE